ncbi:MAG TPA: hypothetical protein VFS67_16355 [Polyangiaceae bacterium]|nr:hypothetical protein [Polyangiaceae bacterium]
MGFRLSGGRLAIGLAMALLGCGPEPVDGEPFTDPSRGPLYLPQPGSAGSSSADRPASEADEPPEERTTLSAAREEPVCCRLCMQGKACGDSCIASELICQAAPGCACDL